MKQKFILLMLLLLSLFEMKAQSIITLEQALDIASKGSPSLQSSLFNFERTTESLNAQRAALKSQFSLNVTPLQYSNSQNFEPYQSKWYKSENISTYGSFNVVQPILYTGGNLSLSNKFSWISSKKDADSTINTLQNDLRLNLTQPLFTYNKTKLAIKNLELDNEYAMLSYAMQRLALEKSVSQYFYNVYLAQMSLSIKQEELANTTKSNEIIKNKVEAGLAAKEQLYQSEVNLSTAESGFESARVSLESAKDLFKQAIGMDIFAEITVMTDVAVTPIEVDGKKALEHGLAARMELRQRQINVETSQFDMLGVKAQNEFRGDMTLSMGLTGISTGIRGKNPNLANIYDTPTKTPSINLSFNIPVFDWGQRKAQIRAQEAVINTQKLNLTSEETQIKVDIRQVIRNLSNLKNQIGIALQTQKNSQLTYDINLERYKNGDLTSMDLNLFQVQLSNNKMAYAQSLINYKIELLNLKIQSLFDFATNEAVVPEKFVKEYEAGRRK